nr:MAG TPA: hypothetical protein [Caudoviricetes sp.]
MFRSSWHWILYFFGSCSEWYDRSNNQYILWQWSDIRSYN